VVAIKTLFPTLLYQARPAGAAAEQMRAGLQASCLAIKAGDTAGRRWCDENGYAGYTSYASLNDLPWRDPVIASLVGVLDEHVGAFARELDYDLERRKLALDSLWINILEPGGMHAGHIHPGSVISGTYYVTLPAGSAGLKFEDPRLPAMMAAPPVRANASQRNRRFVEIMPKPGTILLWESYIRHEVPLSRAKVDRMSISFNYSWPAAEKRSVD
jgi:uncharacterized protein (TIGR02466 family)